MEVHAHSHTARKKWTHYFWEFFMLFLAVFCGFLAENLREHSIEHKREKQYAHTLYEDIKADTAALTGAMAENEYVTNKVDTFRVMVQTQDLSYFSTGTWYYFGRFGTRMLSLAFQDATMEQLKSSGGLRYFKKLSVVNAIGRYDQARRELQTQIGLQNFTYNDIIKSRNKIFNAFYFDEIMDLNISAATIDSFKRKTMPLLSSNKNDFIQYANLCQLRSYNSRSTTQVARACLKSATNLLSELKKEYHLK